jgi:hypothetical protein
MEKAFIHNDEQRLLDAVPNYLSVTSLLKATPVTVGEDRFVYLEASNESVDQQGEVVLAKALADSANYYLKFGNIDIDHISQIGAKAGIPNYELFEIGRPIDVRIENGSTFVKAQIYRGNGVAADNANAFWSSITDLNPPKRWYPSVGGSVISKSIVIDPDTKAKKAVINKVRWTNVAFSRTPVNSNLSSVSTVPFGALAKSWGGVGFDLVKALEAGYGTDSAQLSGGGAMRKQSLEPNLLSYWDFRNQLADAIRTKKVSGGKPAELVKYARNVFGMSVDEAAASVEQFLNDLQRGLKR